RFHQVQGVRSRSHEGSGIGLALVQELVTVLGGTVAVASQEGHGSTFNVRLPAGEGQLGGHHSSAATPPGHSPAPLVDGTLQWVQVSTEAPAPDREVMAPEAPVGRILVADDNPDMLRYIRTILGERWVVQTASDGRAAVQAVRDNPPDLLLLDVMMPELDGFQVLAGLRENPVTARVPVIMLTARAGDEAAAEGLVAGADDYVTKPFASVELSARVATQVKAARARATAEAAVRERDAFVALVVHDLNHPLAALNWHL